MKLKSLLKLEYLLIFTCLMIFQFNTFANDKDEVHALSTFDQLNSQDIEAAAIAVTRGKSSAVRMVGKMIIDDHIPLMDKFRTLVKEEGLGVLSPQMLKAASDHEVFVQGLLKKEQKEFDQYYIDYELAFSKGFVKTLKDDVYPKVKNPKLKTLIETTIVQFEEHLTHIGHTVMMLKSE